MTPAQCDLEALITDCSNGANLDSWLVLADALEDTGRDEEASLIRSDTACCVRDGIVVPFYEGE